MKIYAFDFDGTLTTKDTFVEFIRFSKGNGRALAGFLWHAHLLVLMKLKLYPNWKAKQKLFSYFFKGTTIEQFNALCKNFARQHSRLIRPQGFEIIRKALLNHDKVVIISASIDNWVKPFFDEFEGNIAIAGTEIEVREDRLTGFFATKNCYGAEKVNRLQALFPNRSEYKLIAFGDSRGDKELLEYADKGYFQPFRQ